MPGLRTLTKTPLFRRLMDGGRNASVLPPKVQEPMMKGSVRLRSKNARGEGDALRSAEDLRKEESEIPSLQVQVGEEWDPPLRASLQTEKDEQCYLRKSGAGFRQR